VLIDYQILQLRLRILARLTYDVFIFLSLIWPLRCSARTLARSLPWRMILLFLQLNRINPRLRRLPPRNTLRLHRTSNTSHSPCWRLFRRNRSNSMRLGSSTLRDRACSFSNVSCTSFKKSRPNACTCIASPLRIAPWEHCRSLLPSPRRRRVFSRCKCSCNSGNVNERDWSHPTGVLRQPKGSPVGEPVLEAYLCASSVEKGIITY
jgi:hypothetical protein